MMNTKKLIKMARKWQRMAALKRKRISLPRSRSKTTDTSLCGKVAGKGQFVVYTADKRRYAFPMSYLSNAIFRELLEMSEEEFGLSVDGPITLPCDSVLLEYLFSLIQRLVDSDTEKALLMSISSSRCSFSCSLQQDQTKPQLLVF